MQQNQQSDTKTHVGFATTPEPPYYAVIFTSQRTEGDRGYEAMAQAMFELALKQPGCLGAESVRDGSGLGIRSHTSRTSRPFRHGSRIPSTWSPSASARSTGIPIMS